MKETRTSWALSVMVGVAIAVSGTALTLAAGAEGEGKTQSSSGAGQRAGFDIFLMGVVTKTNYDATPPTVTMKVIEGALERLGQEVEIIIETEEAIKHFKRRVKVGIELDTRVRVGTDGKLYMATSQRRGIPSREFKGGPTIDESVKKLLESGG
ncbi:MAG: hypothetical protein HY581_02615 [Nitrospirae bacterium]|nr:hypothetical protein [Nitrospirota bacterium]